MGRFTNVLLAAFTPADPESAKKTNNLTVFFTLLGSARVKAAQRALMKLTHDLLTISINFFPLFHFWEIYFVSGLMVTATTTTTRINLLLRSKSFLHVVTSTPRSEKFHYKEVYTSIKGNNWWRGDISFNAVCQNLAAQAFNTKFRSLSRLEIEI
jgi:hypothetical protein